MKKNIKRFMSIAFLLVIIINFGYPVYAYDYPVLYNEGEPNNSESTAHAMSTNTYVVGHLKNGDVDFFKFTPDTYTRVKIYHEGISNVDMMVKIKEDNRELINGKGSIEFSASPYKTYIIRLTPRAPYSVDSDYSLYIDSVD